MKEKIVELLVENSKRLDKLKEILDKNEIEYTIDSKNNADNLIVKLGQEDNTGSVVVLGAHYDLFPGRTGINDNTCSLLLLLEFIKKAKDKKLVRPIEVVFFDKEESGMVGSNMYAKNNFNRVSYALIFDIIGYGDTLVYGNTDNKLDELFSGTDIKKLSTVLPSDNITFEAQKIPTALITAAHKKDLKASLSVKMAYTVRHTAEFYSSFHNRENDNNIEIINVSLIESLLSVLCSTFFLE